MAFDTTDPPRESPRSRHMLAGLGSGLYYSGFRGGVSHSTLADPTTQTTIQSMPKSRHAGEHFGVDLEQTTYALQATAIDLRLTLFPWAMLYFNYIIWKVSVVYPIDSYWLNGLHMA
jgi:hypothetical protein